MHTWQRNSKLTGSEPGILKGIGAIGLGPFVMESSSSFMMIFVYHALANYGGDVVIAVFGIVMRINAFIFLPLLGMSFGLQPIVGYNYGAKQFGRIVEAVKFSLAVTTGFWLLGLLIMCIFSEQLLGFFSADPEYLAVEKTL